MSEIRAEVVRCSECSFKSICLARSNVVQEIVNLPFVRYIENWEENCNNKRDEKVEWADKLRYAVARSADEFLAKTCSYYTWCLTLSAEDVEALKKIGAREEK